jgi:uncharacterized Zn-binding protein involved in type VI secretion
MDSLVAGHVGAQRIYRSGMGVQVVATAQLMCSFGVAPSVLSVVPKGLPVQAGGMMAATIQDFAPNVNIMPFGMCMTLSNPQVAAATSAALGVLTPQPCIPVTTSPWSPGSPTVQINGAPALTATSMCQCAWGGVITISNPGQMQTQTA